MFQSLNRLIILFAAIFLFGAGCISFGGSGGAQGIAGGVFKSANYGKDWAQSSAVPTPAGVANFGGANVTVLAMDPQDRLAIYAGTDEAGMLYSFDGGNSWMRARDITRGYVADIEIDPKNKCIVYVATANQIFKTEDCNRTFQDVYRESMPQSFISSIAISRSNPNIIYAGTTKGIIVKSTDAGRTWAQLGNFRRQIQSVAVDLRNPNIVYVAVRQSGVWKSEDGRQFRDLSESLKDALGSRDRSDPRMLILDDGTPDALLLVVKNKIVRSSDGGATWKALPVISPENVDIFTVAAHPNNSREIYYGTATTLYHSSDGGERWSTEKLPSRRQASAILVDPEIDGLIYLGMLEAQR